MNQSITSPASSADLQAVLAALHKDYAKLAPRIRELQHEVACDGSGVTLRLHFPSFRQAKTTVRELVDQVWLSLPHFALSRKEIDDLKTKQATLPFEDFLAAATLLNDAAAKRTNRVSLLGGDPNAPVVISNVAAGVADTDAVNLGQLNAGLADTLSAANSYTDRSSQQTLQQANSYTDSMMSNLGSGPIDLRRAI